MRSPELTKEGHWHPDSVYALARRRGVRAWRIEFEQKRPDVFSTGYEIGGSGLLGIWNRGHHIWVGSREGSMLFRDGEDGSKFTEIYIPLPWPGFGREWRVYTDQEKWSVTVIALAETSPLTTLPRVAKVAWSDIKRWWKRRKA